MQCCAHVTYLLQDLHESLDSSRLLYWHHSRDANTLSISISEAHVQASWKYPHVSYNILYSVCKRIRPLQAETRWKPNACENIATCRWTPVNSQHDTMRTAITWVKRLTRVSQRRHWQTDRQPKPNRTRTPVIANWSCVCLCSRASKYLVKRMKRVCIFRIHTCISTRWTTRSHNTLDHSSHCGTTAVDHYPRRGRQLCCKLSRTVTSHKHDTTSWSNAEKLGLDLNWMRHGVKPWDFLFLDEV